MDVCTLGLLSALLAVTVSGSQTCLPQAIPDMVIDISQAVARGARFTDPLRVTSVEDCVSACCMDMGGDQDCNLIVFDARKGPGLQNCYIFHCPTPDSCPLSPSPGVFSYSLWSETFQPGKHDPDKGQQKPKSMQGKTSGSAESGPPDNKKKSAAIASQGSAKHYAKEEPAISSKSITTQLLHLADKVDQHLEKMESKSGASADHLQVHYPSPTAAIVPSIRTTTGPVHKRGPDRVTYKKPEDLKIYFPTEAAIITGTVPDRTSPRLGTDAPQPVPRTKASHIVPPAASQGVKKVPSSAIKSAKLPANDDAARETPKKVNRPLPPTKAPALTTVHQPRAPQMVTHPAPLRTSPWKGIKPNTKTTDQPSTADKGKTPGRALPETHPPAQQEPAVNLEEAPRKAEGAGSWGALPSLEDKSGLVAALVFGMLFLIVVIGLVSRKVSEARRRHRYTKLDYLINGMYVDT